MGRFSEQVFSELLDSILLRWMGSNYLSTDAELSRTSPHLFQKLAQMKSLQDVGSFVELDSTWCSSGIWDKLQCETELLEDGSLLSMNASYICICDVGCLDGFGELLHYCLKDWRINNFWN